MKLTFLGTGTAFTLNDNNYHSNMLLENSAGERLLIDCGSDARFSLHELGLSHHDIHHVYISHLHADHAGGLEWLGFTTKFDKECEKPHLYINDALADDLWNKSLAGGLSSLQGTMADLSTYFHLHRIKENESFVWQGTTLELVRTLHVMNGSSPAPNFGLMFNTDGINVLITSDTQFCPPILNPYYLKADVIFHDCDIAPVKSKVHSHFTELCKLDPKIKSKMWLYHYDTSAAALPDAKKNGFCGFVKKGQCFDFEI